MLEQRKNKRRQWLRPTILAAVTIILIGVNMQLARTISAEQLKYAAMNRVKDLLSVAAADLGKGQSSSAIRTADRAVDLMRREPKETFSPAEVAYVQLRAINIYWRAQTKAGNYKAALAAARQGLVESRTIAEPRPYRTWRRQWAFWFRRYSETALRGLNTPSVRDYLQREFEYARQHHAGSKHSSQSYLMLFFATEALARLHFAAGEKPRALAYAELRLQFANEQVKIRPGAGFAVLSLVQAYEAAAMFAFTNNRISKGKNYAKKSIALIDSFTGSRRQVRLWNHTRFAARWRVAQYTWSPSDPRWSSLIADLKRGDKLGIASDFRKAWMSWARQRNLM